MKYEGKTYLCAVFPTCAQHLCGMPNLRIITIRTGASLFGA